MRCTYRVHRCNFSAHTTTRRSTIINYYYYHYHRLLSTRFGAVGGCTHWSPYAVVCRTSAGAKARERVQNQTAFNNTRCVYTGHVYTYVLTGEIRPLHVVYYYYYYYYYHHHHRYKHHRHNLFGPRSYYISPVYRMYHHTVFV
jgi:hypothetical protein